MAGRGVHFAITAEQREKLLAASDDEAKVEYVQEEIEEAWDKAHLCETDKAWHPIHLALRRQDRSEEGTQLPDPKGDPAALAVCGSRQVLEESEEYAIGLVEPEEVASIAAALAPIDLPAFKALYDTYCRDVQPEYDDDGLEYSWEYFQALRDFYKAQAGNGRTVIFSVDF